MSAPTIDHLLASDWQTLEGTPFENFLAQVFDALGYWVERKGAQTRRTQGDHGVDLLVSAGSSRIAVQAKGLPSGGQAGVDAVRAVHCAKQYYGCKACVAITNSTFSSAAKDEAARFACRLVDRHRLPYLIRGEVLPFYPAQGAARCPHCQKGMSFASRFCGAPTRCPSCSRGCVLPRITFSPAARFEQARQLLEAGDLASGYALINELCRTHPWYQGPPLLYATSFYQLRRFPEALKFYRKAIRLGDCDLLTYARAAHAACESGGFAEARRLLEVAESQFRKADFTAEVWITWGRVEAQQSNPTAALKHLRRAIRMGAADPARYENDLLLIPLREEQGFLRLLARLQKPDGRRREQLSRAGE
jgi:hypothetical protein